MKTNKFVLLSALLAICSVVSAQEYAFKVLANKGNNEVKSGETWQPLKTGAALKSGDEVRLSDNAYVGLVHNSGKPVEVKQAGVHKVSALETKVGSGSSVLNKYTDFILSSNSAEAKKNSLSATGAVHRDISEASAIKVFLPEKDNTGIFNRTAVINWEANNVAGPYVVTVINMFEDVLVKQETPETTFEVDLSDEKFASETAILVQVSAKSDAKLVSKQHMIKRLSPAELEKVSAAMKEIKSEIGDETAMNKLLLASFFEKNNLFIDAIAAYEQAVKLEPEVAAFKESYEEFLVRNRLK
jgi:hypothetical protein